MLKLSWSDLLFFSDIVITVTGSTLSRISGAKNHLQRNVDIPFAKNIMSHSATSYWKKKLLYTRKSLIA